MDDLLKLDFLKLATPILTGITYFSAFKNGKPTCDRFMVNNFLYLLVSLMIYITAIKVYEEKNIRFGNNEAGVKFGLVILCIIFLVSISYVDNQLIKHLFGILFIILLAYIVKGQIEKYDKELIKDTILKVTIIVLACVLIAITFPQFIKPSMGNILIIGLLAGIIFKIIDTVILDRKYTNYISYIMVALFTGFVIYDTDRVRKVGENCKKTGMPNYLSNMVDMFLNIINLFSNIAAVNE